MNAIDIVILVPVLWGFWRGYTKGAIMAAATLAAFFLGVWGGMHFSDWTADHLRSWTGSQSPYIPLISFALVFVGILFLVYGTGKLVERIAESASLGLINKLLGGVIGTAKFLFILSTLFFVIDGLEKQIEIIPPAMKEKSLLYHPVAKLAPVIVPGLKETDFGKMVPSIDSLRLEDSVPLKDSAAVKIQLRH